jgi:hypothetical protein
MLMENGVMQHQEKSQLTSMPSSTSNSAEATQVRSLQGPNSKRLSWSVEFINFGLAKVHDGDMRGALKEF